MRIESNTMNKLSLLKETNPEYSLEGLFLKLQYFGPDVKRQLTGKEQDPTLTTGSIFDWLLCLFDILCHCGLIFFSKISLLSGTTRYCRLNLFISYIIFRISKKAWFLWSEMVLETKILAQGILNKYVFNGGKGIVNVCQRRVSCHKKYQNNWWYLKGTVHWMTRRNCLDLYYCLLILLVQRENLHFILVISNMGIYFPNMVNELEALSFSQTKTLN